MEPHFAKLLTLGPTELLGGAPPSVLYWLMPLSAFVIGTMVPFFGRKVRRTSQFAVPSLEAIPSYRQRLPEFARELDRVRRYERALSILVLRIDDRSRDGKRDNGSGRLDSDFEIRFGKQVTYAQAGQVLRDSVREVDLVASDVGNESYVLLLPELNAEQALGTAKRLQSLLLRGAGARVRYGVAAFGEDGLLVDDLVIEAAQRCEQTLSGGATVMPLEPSVNRTSHVSA